MDQAAARALGRSPVVLIHGARQTGKSTLARQLARRRDAAYLTLDDATTLGAALRDPAGFIAASDRPIVVDEVQRAPDLTLAIKAAVDRNRRPGRFLLTGSANVMLAPRLSDSLAGRIEILTLWPLSQGEFDGVCEGFVDALFARKLPSWTPPRRPGPALVERIVRGGYPEVLRRRSAADRAAWYSDYITTILQRDVRDMAEIEGLTDLPRLLRLLASRVGSLLNVADVSRGLQLPYTTLRRYLTLLEATFLLQPAPPWSANLGQRLVKSPKAYLVDTGLAANLLGADRARLTADTILAGHLLENLVVAELRKQTGWSVALPALHHFRTHGGAEVDIVLEDAAGRIVGVEVTGSATVGGEKLRGLRELATLAGRRFIRGVVLYTGRDVVPLGEHFTALPIEALWSLGAT